MIQPDTHSMPYETRDLAAERDGRLVAEVYAELERAGHAPTIINMARVMLRLRWLLVWGWR